MPNPIQVVVDSSVYRRDVQPARTPRTKTDFFAHNDAAFAKHKEALISSIDRARQRLLRHSMPIGFAKVKLQSKALAKSHRPTSKLFLPKQMPLVGADDLGELIFEVSPQALASVSTQVHLAEPETREYFNEKTNRIEYNPTRIRSEVGAIEEISLIGAEDKQKFSVATAVNWLADPRTAHAYRIELFWLPTPDEWEALPTLQQGIVHDLFTKLSEIGDGLVVELLDQRNALAPWLRVQLFGDRAPGAFNLPAHFLPKQTNDIAPERKPILPKKRPFEVNAERHDKLLSVLTAHPLVRGVYLTPRIYRSQMPVSRISAGTATLPKRLRDQVYPRVAVVDGGIGASLSDWVVDGVDLLTDDHRNEDHGTFIGGLLVAAKSLNTNGIIDEADGCELFDIAICPDENDPDAEVFGGPDEFLERLQEIAERFKDQVRIYNVSLTMEEESSPHTYSYDAEVLDQIAHDTDAIIVLAGGNLDEDPRPEWSSDVQDSIRDLAACRDPRILTPAESIKNISVSALNPKGIAGVVPDAPACYSRRGPGLRCGVKPDFAHYGGAPPTKGRETGILSVDPSGRLIQAFGTSYAAPLVAKTLAALDYSIAGPVPRETLIALLVHYAAVTGPLADSACKAIARDFVGFGLPLDSAAMLENSEHEITLVFHDRILPGKYFQFDFPWPASLTLPGGACKGWARMTCVASSPLDHSRKSELSLVNVDAALRQRTNGEHFESPTNDLKPKKQKATEHAYERERIREAGKWHPIKVFQYRSPRGAGKSSDWQIYAEALARDGYRIPDEGVPFTIILTIRDLEGEANVYNDVRAALIRSDVKLADIKTVARIRAGT